MWWPIWRKWKYRQSSKLMLLIVLFSMDDLIGTYPFKKIVVSQIDYERNPFYGLNQLPSFMSFTDEFTYEIKFLKPTWIPIWKQFAFRQQKTQLDLWRIQVYAMMKYIEENHPNTKMLGSASTFLLLKSYNLTNLDFNEQYSYFYMLMARKTLISPWGPKNSW
jgi:hypothetical protein